MSLPWPPDPQDGSTWIDGVARIDGTLFVALHGGRLYEITGYERQFIAALEDRALYEVTNVQGSSVATPADADKVTGLSGDGYALAITYDTSGQWSEVQVWGYEGGSWVALAAMTPDAVPDYATEPGRVRDVDGDVVAYSKLGSVYAVRGSALRYVTAEDATGLEVELRNFSDTPIGQHWPAHWRGHLYGIGPKDDEDSYVRTLRMDDYTWTWGAAVPAFITGALAWRVRACVADGNGFHMLAGYPGHRVQASGLWTGTWARWVQVRPGRILAKTFVQADDDPVPQILDGAVDEEGQVWAYGLDTTDVIRPGLLQTIQTPPMRLYLITDSDLRLFSAHLEWMDEPSTPGLEEAHLEWGGGTGNSPTLASAGIEWGAGSGNTPTISEATLQHQALAMPVLHSAGVEWRTPNYSIPTLLEAKLEWSEGSGDNSPTLASAELEWGAGTGNSTPTVEAAELMWRGLHHETPSLAIAGLEWAEYHGPGDGEGIFWLTANDDELIANALRIVTNWTLDDQKDLRAIVRCDAEIQAVDAWGTYEEVAIGADHYLSSPGHHVRVGIIGPTDRDPPNVQVVFDRHLP